MDFNRAWGRNKKKEYQAHRFTGRIPGMHACKSLNPKMTVTVFACLCGEEGACTLGKGARSLFWKWEQGGLGFEYQASHQRAILHYDDSYLLILASPAPAHFWRRNRSAAGRAHALSSAITACCHQVGSGARAAAL